ncbi:MAG: DUF433 domain-containing protein [Thermoguttaceae bacterium]|jgi:uncharacterized protein (DUF433 family)
MEKVYVEARDEGYWVSGTRVSLDSVVLAFVQGLSPETIAGECFPTLTLEQVYGAIAYYLAHRAEIDGYLKTADAEFESLRQTVRNAAPEFSQKLTEARRQMPTALEKWSSFTLKASKQSPCPGMPARCT